MASASASPRRAGPPENQIASARGRSRPGRREIHSLSSRTHAWLRVEWPGADGTYRDTFAIIEFLIERTIKKIFW
jgi:hypothetical protein